MDIKNQLWKIAENIWNNPQYMTLICVMLPIIIFGLLMNIPAFKGWIGEMYLHLGMKWFLPKEKYHLFRNVTLPTKDGTTQIDHVVVSEFGIFVIETKNMKGWIFGSEKSKTWTQQIYKHKSKFQNPLHQNYKHTKTLANILEIPHEKLHSLIAFVGGATLKKEVPENVRTSGWVTYIKSFKDKVLTSDEISLYCELIGENRLKTNWKTHRQHVGHVKEIVAAKQQKSIEVKCNLPASEDEIEQGIDVTNTVVDTEESDEKSYEIQCSHCKSQNVTIAYGHSYYIKCGECSKNMPIEGLNCSSCGSEARVRKQKQEYFIKCRSCDEEQLIFSNTILGKVGGKERYLKLGNKRKTTHL